MTTYLERLRARELENVKITFETGEDDGNQADNCADDAIFIKQALGEDDEKTALNAKIHK